MFQKAVFRAKLKQRFFKAINGVVVHCDDDFTPLNPSKVVRLLVKTLAKQRLGYFENYMPVLVNLYSHESKSIQIADIIAGMVKTRLENREIAVLRSLPFDARKLTAYSNHLPKAYFWTAKEEM
ncbi:MAG: hypothetical protein LBQ98_01125 [Nitrososphaerota archaeon]|nr:hypothetical protein [Nitrososphaerota archaeon]